MPVGRAEKLWRSSPRDAFVGQTDGIADGGPQHRTNQSLLEPRAGIPCWRRLLKAILSDRRDQQIAHSLRFSSEIYVPRQSAFVRQPMNGREKSLKSRKRLRAFELSERCRSLLAPIVPAE